MNKDLGEGRMMVREGKSQQELMSCSVDRLGICLKQVEVVWPVYL